MTGDPLDLLREADPVPDGGAAPALAQMMAVVRDFGAPASDLSRDRRDRRDQGDAERPPQPGRRRGAGWVRVLRPALGVAAALAVVAAIVLLAVDHGNRSDRLSPTVTTIQEPATTVPAPDSLMPRHGGMVGLVANLSTSGSGSNLTAAFIQCATCTTRFRSNAEGRWTATSSDGGRTWHVGRHAAPTWEIGQEVQSGQTIWATGSQGSTPVIFVSHDGGRTYRVAPTPVAPSSDSPITIADGTVWAFGSRCTTGGHCRGVVLSGPVGGSRLTATAAQPALRPRRGEVNAAVSARGADAYVTTGEAAAGADLQTFASHDGGRSWTRVTYPCRRPTEGDVEASGAGSLWAVCLGTRPGPRAAKGPIQPGKPIDTLLRSSDGGRHWTTLPVSLAVQQPTLDPVSDQVAWLTGENGTVQRTTDGGQSWRTVLRLPARQGLGQLVVRSGSAATIVVEVTAGTVAGHDRRTELVAYRTTDGGAHWQATLVHLPNG